MPYSLRICRAEQREKLVSGQPLELRLLHCAFSPVSQITVVRTLYKVSSKHTGLHLFGLDKSPVLGTGASVPHFQDSKS
eukprot:12087364-Ditylum_brightwellii.AAC.1